MSIFPHFRIYKKSKHPALIEGYAKIETPKDGFIYRKTSHSKGLTKRGYEKVSPNPNPKDPKPMYIEKRKRVDFKDKFTTILPWKYKQKK